VRNRFNIRIRHFFFFGPSARGHRPNRRNQPETDGKSLEKAIREKAPSRARLNPTQGNAHRAASSLL
jgi:hypothetical protein